MKKFVFGIAFVSLLVGIMISGCIGNGENKMTDKDEAKDKTNAGEPIILCTKICEDFKKNLTDLSNGPCLSNDFYPDYVCDVAHFPRKDTDNKPENQCPAYREGRAHHFVEVDENCTLIKEI